jgi:acetyl esterase/lipase
VRDHPDEEHRAMTDLTTLPDGPADVQPLPPVRIWPGVAPGSETSTHQEHEDIDPSTGHRLLRGVVVPTITPVLPRPGTESGTGVVIAPGGAFTGLAWDHEGLATARWLAEQGIAAFVLKYRLARVPADPAELEALQRSMPDPGDAGALLEWSQAVLASAIELATSDGEQAVRVVRERAATWGVNPDRVGILGYSAGGTVATQAAVTCDPAARPAFVVNAYGAWFAKEVPTGAPPLFGVAAADDPLVGTWLKTAQAWLEAGVPTELHLYERGGHGFAVATQGLPVDGWTERLTAWLISRGLLAQTGRAK